MGPKGKRKAPDETIAEATPERAMGPKGKRRAPDEMIAEATPEQTKAKGQIKATLKEAEDLGSLGPQATSQGPIHPDDAREPGNLANPLTFYTINPLEPVAEERRLAAYLGFGTVASLREFALSWPVLECLAKVHPLLPKAPRPRFSRSAKRGVLAIYRDNQRWIEEAAIHSDWKMQDGWPIYYTPEADANRSSWNALAFVASRVYRMIQELLWTYPQMSVDDTNRLNEHARLSFFREFRIQMPDVPCAVYPTQPSLRPRSWRESEFEAFNRAFELIEYMGSSLRDPDLWKERFGSIDAVMKTELEVSQKDKPEWMRSDIPGYRSLQLPRRGLGFFSQFDDVGQEPADGGQGPSGE